MNPVKELERLELEVNSKKNDLVKKIEEGSELTDLEVNKYFEVKDQYEILDERFKAEAMSYSLWR